MQGAPLAQLGSLLDVRVDADAGRVERGQRSPVEVANARALDGQHWVAAAVHHLRKRQDSQPGCEKKYELVPLSGPA